MTPESQQAFEDALRPQPPSAGLTVPPKVVESLQRYVAQGIPTGGALRSILANDLFGAAARMDPVLSAALYDIVRYVVNYLPTEAWGSYSIVDNWPQRRRELAAIWEESRGVVAP